MYLSKGMQKKGLYIQKAAELIAERKIVLESLGENIKELEKKKEEMASKHNC